MWNAEDPDDEALAMVVRTNFNTTMGSMARQLLAPVRMKQINPLMQASLHAHPCDTLQYA